MCVLPDSRLKTDTTAFRSGQKPLRLVPINEAAVELTSGMLGAAVGFSVGGPVLGVLGASAANYFSREDARCSDMRDLTQIVSESTISSVNLAGAVLNTFDVDDLVVNAAQKDDFKPLLASAQGTLRTAGNILSAVGDLNFLLVQSVVDISDRTQLPSKATELVSKWWETASRERKT